MLPKAKFVSEKLPPLQNLSGDREKRELMGRLETSVKPGGGAWKRAQGASGGWWEGEKALLLLPFPPFPMPARFHYLKFPLLNKRAPGDEAVRENWRMFLDWCFQKLICATNVSRKQCWLDSSWVARCSAPFARLCKQLIKKWMDCDQESFSLP